VIVLFKEVILAAVVSVDTLLASAAYCGSGIRIPSSSATLINLISSAVLYISLMFSELAMRCIPVEICRISGFIIMTAIGMFAISKSLVRGIVRRISRHGELSLRLGSEGIVMKLYLDDTAADRDHSKILSLGEAAALAAAGSLDSAAMGLSAGLTAVRPLYAALFTFIAGTLAIILGNIAGKKISSMNRDLSWTGGVLLIVFALLSFCHIL